MTMEAKRPLAERSPSAEGRGTLEGATCCWLLAQAHASKIKCMIQNRNLNCVTSQW